MNFNLTKEQELIQKAAQEFAEKYLDPIAKQIDEENRGTRRNSKNDGRFGLIGNPFPRGVWGSWCRIFGFCAGHGTTSLCF